MRRESGFTIVTALFLIVALASLGAAILHLSAAQHVGGALDIQGSRALAAARAGSEWQVAAIMAAEADNNPRYACATPAAFAFAGFALTVSCSHSTHDEEGNRVRVYRIVSTATTGGSPGMPAYVERQVDTVAATCRRTDDGLLC